MPASAELNGLAGRKAELRRRIASARASAQADAERCADALRWLDRLVAVGLRLAPYAALLPTVLRFVRSRAGR